MIGFAHRGAPAPGMRENTLAAFRHALENGAAALESDVWLTVDRVPVLVHDGAVRKGLRRQEISALPAAEVPDWLPPLDALYAELGGEFDLSLDVKNPAAARPTVEVAARHGAEARLWLCGNAGEIREWRAFSGEARLVVSTTLRDRGRAMAEGRIDEAAAAGGYAVNLRAPEWSAARVQHCHDLGMQALAWDVQRRQVLERVRGYGCDGFFSDHVSLLKGA